MERLTKMDGMDANECIKCFGCGLKKAGVELEHCGYCEHWQHILDRLAAYEDTGLTPEEIMGLCEMDRRAKMAEVLRELPAVDAVPAAIQAQLDAAMCDLKLVANCDVCKNAMQNGGCCRGGCRGLVGSKYSFEWRGETAPKEANQ